MQNTNEGCHVAPLIVRHSGENALFVFSLVLTTTQLGNCPRFSSEHRFSFGRKAGERRTWVYFTSQGSSCKLPWDLYYPKWSVPYFMSLWEKAESLGGRTSHREVQREERDLLGITPNTCSSWGLPGWFPPGGALNPALPALWAPDKMTACGDEGVSWIPSLRLSPGISFFCFSQMLLSWEFRETKQSLLLKLKSFPWLIVPVALLLTILPPPPQPLFLLPPLPHLLCCLCSSHSLALYDS